MTSSFPEITNRFTCSNFDIEEPAACFLRPSNRSYRDRTHHDGQRGHRHSAGVRGKQRGREQRSKAAENCAQLPTTSYTAVSQPRVEQLREERRLTAGHR